MWYLYNDYVCLVFFNWSAWAENNYLASPHTVQRVFLSCSMTSLSMLTICVVLCRYGLNMLYAGFEVIHSGCIYNWFPRWSNSHSHLEFSVYIYNLNLVLIIKQWFYMYLRSILLHFYAELLTLWKTTGRCLHVYVQQVRSSLLSSHNTVVVVKVTGYPYA